MWFDPTKYHISFNYFLSLYCVFLYDPWALISFVNAHFWYLPSIALYESCYLTLRIILFCLEQIVPQTLGVICNHLNDTFYNGLCYLPHSSTFVLWIFLDHVFHLVPLLWVPYNKPKSILSSFYWKRLEIALVIRLSNSWSFTINHMSLDSLL